MKEQEIIKRAEVVAAQFKGLDMKDATDVLGEALVIAAKEEPIHIAIAIYYIGKLIEEMKGRSALVKIEDDGHLSFSIAANGVENKLF